MRRLRAFLALGCLVVGAMAAAVSAAPTRATAASGLDVYNVKGVAAPVEISIKTGYSFVVYPDAQMPRAVAAIEGSQVGALASPADPGDSVDTLPGLAVPQGESAIAGAFTDKDKLGQFPEPFKSAFSQAAKLIPVIGQANPYLTTPYEHVQVNYPNARSPGRQSATFGADPQVADPTGVFAIRSGLGSVVADKDVGIADAGAGSALTVAPLNLSIGRVSSHVEVHGLGGKATSDAVSSVQSLDFNPPGISVPQLPPLGVPTANQPILHIDSITSTVHTERAAGADHATSSHNLQIAGVKVLGQAASIDQNGVHLASQNQSLKPVVDALNQLFAAAKTANGALPKQLPLFGGQTVIPEGTMAGPIVNESLSHNGDQANVDMSGLTLSLKSTVLVPSSTQGALPPDPKHPPTLVPSPVTYTITLATASSSAYGYNFPADAFASLAPVAPLSSGADGGGAESSDSGSADTGAGATPGATPGAGGKSRPAQAAGAFLDPAHLGKGGVVALASVAELLMIGALISSYRMPARRPESDVAANLDMI